MTSCGNYFTGLGYGCNGVSCAYRGCGSGYGCGYGCGYGGLGYGSLGYGYGCGYGGLGCGYGGWGCGVYGYGGNRPSFCRRYCLYGSY